VPEEPITGTNLGDNPGVLVIFADTGQYLRVQQYLQDNIK